LSAAFRSFELWKQSGMAKTSHPIKWVKIFIA
jgi:hypothetical protein